MKFCASHCIYVFVCLCNFHYLPDIYPASFPLFLNLITVTATAAAAFRHTNCLPFSKLLCCISLFLSAKNGGKVNKIPKNWIQWIHLVPFHCSCCVCPRQTSSTSEIVRIELQARDNMNDRERERAREWEENVKSSPRVPAIWTYGIYMCANENEENWAQVLLNFITKCLLAKDGLQYHITE